RRRILGKEHKSFLLNCIDKNPFSIVTEVTESLMKKFEDINVPHSTIYNFLTTECNLLSRHNSSL
ncbi:hypothetical protein BCV71DRAFT_271683, partial [Rhizopus microsporus]